MKTISITNMHITNVFQRIPLPQREFIDIYFELQGHPYCLRTDEELGLYKPVAIYHEFEDECVFCGKSTNGSLCLTLIKQPHLNDLFQRLIQIPSIRLEWLFIPHEERGNEDENI